jgi:hypothetical protein
MRRHEEHRGDRKPAETGKENCKLRQAAVFVVLLLIAFLAPSASAEPNESLRFEQLPENFRYVEDYDDPAYSFSYRRGEEISVAAPTKFRIKSILQYTSPLGDTGLILKVKLPLKMKKLVKVEIRF